MHLMENIFEWLALVIDVSAAIIMVLAFVVAVFTYFRSLISKNRNNFLTQMQLMRCELGVKLVFALELLIISDLLHTMVSRSLEDMALVGALVVIRTVISYFVNREIADIHAEISGLPETERG